MLNEKRIFLFDIDGTLAVDTTLYKGTKELLTYIESIQGYAFYITNNSTKSRKDYVKKFADWGIPTTEEQFVTASYASCLYLKETYGEHKLFVLGTPSFQEELSRFGLRVTEQVEDDVVCVVVGFDTTLRYEQVRKACELLFRKEVDYVGTNPDLRCPTSFGFMPDCGGICEMLYATVERVPYFIGKPNPKIVELCLAQVNGRKEETLVVGDRLYTDIACGIYAEVETAAVLTGETTLSEIKESKFQPNYCFETVEDLLKCLKAKPYRVEGDV